MPAPGPFPEEYREEQNTGKEEEKKEEKGLRVVIEHRVGKAGSSALARCRTKGSRASERRKYEENEGRRARRREGRVVKRSKKIRAGTEKGEKKRWRCNEVESNQSRSRYSIMLGYLDYGIPASRNLATWGGRNGVFQDTRLALRSLSLASPLLLRHGFVASEHPLILFCRVKLRN